MLAVSAISSPISLTDTPRAVVPHGGRGERAERPRESPRLLLQNRRASPRRRRRRLWSTATRDNLVSVERAFRRVGARLAPVAGTLRLHSHRQSPVAGTGPGSPPAPQTPGRLLVAEADLQPEQILDFGENLPTMLSVAVVLDLMLRLRIEVGGEAVANAGLKLADAPFWIWELPEGASLALWLLTGELVLSCAAAPPLKGSLKAAIRGSRGARRRLPLCLTV